MNKHLKRNIGCFAANYRDKKAIVGGKVFLAGHFFMNSLNEYWKEAPDGASSNPPDDWLIGNRLMSTHLHMWDVQDDIVTGRLDENVAAKVHECIQYILRVIRRAKPFCYLDLAAEKERCDSLFGAESISRINRFLQMHAQYALQGDSYSRPDSVEIRQLKEEQKHMDSYLTTLDYYYNLGNDMNAALDFGTAFVKRIAHLEKRDESHLIRLAMDCMKQVPFGRWNKPFQKVISPDVEYVAMPKAPKSNNYVVGKRMTFVRFLDFLAADFFEGLHAGHYPLLCENCDRYYLKTNARLQKYCTFTDPNDPSKRTCQAVAAAKGRAAKERHPLKYPYENRMKTIRTHVMRGKITEEQAAIAAEITRERFWKAMEDVVYANTLYVTEIGQDSIYKAAGIKMKKPPKMPLNDCIIQYKQTGDERFLQYFLHFYEPTLNKRTENFCEQYGQFHHFLDIKQTIITTLLTQIDRYNPEIGASLLTFTQKHVDAAVHDYIRLSSGVTCAGEYDYDNLRSIMAIMGEISEATPAERLQAAIDKTGLPEKDVQQHIQHSDLFRHSESLTRGNRDDDGDFLQLIERLGSIYDSPEYIVIEKFLYEALVTAVDKLPYKEKRLLLSYYGLERVKNRFRETKPTPKLVLAARLHIGKIQAVDDNARRAVALLRTVLEKQGWV